MKQKSQVKQSIGPMIVSCPPTDHAFGIVDLTPRSYTAMSMPNYANPVSPLIKLYCSKCGEIRSIA